MMRETRATVRGLTLIELMVVIAIMAVIVVLVAPSFQQTIVMQRLRGVNSQLVTDLQFARSEAVSRGTPARLVFGTSGTQTCYVIYVSDANGLGKCDCTKGSGNACSTPGTTEIRTVSVPISSQVQIALQQGNGFSDTGFGFDPVTGGLIDIPDDWGSSPLAGVSIKVSVDDDRALMNNLQGTGRISVCAPNSSVMQVQACKAAG